MPELSASQVRTYRACARQWAFKYLSGLDDPPKSASEMGKDCHEIWEEWLAYATPPDGSAWVIAQDRAAEIDIASVKLLEHGVDAYAERLTAITMNAVPHLPAPRSHDLVVEGEFHFEDRGIQWRGYKDLTWWPEPGHLVLHDHKTTSNLRWAKSHEQLRIDEQVNLYALSEFRKHDLDKIEANWHYTTTTNPTTKKVHLTVYREDAEKYCEELARDGRAMLQGYEQRPDPNQLPPAEDLATCDAYGGCPYKNTVCKLTTTDRIRASFRYSQERKVGMNFFERMKQTPGFAADDSSKDLAPSVSKGAPPRAPDPPQAQPPAPPEQPKTLREKLGAPPPSPGASGFTPPTAVIAQEKNEEVAKSTPVAKKPGPGRPPKKPVESSTAPYNGFRLFVNCAPTSDGTPLSVILKPLCDQVAQELGVEDYRLANFGKGKDALAYALEERLKQQPLVGDIVVDTRTPEGALCLVTLQKYAACEFRGF